MELSEKVISKKEIFDGKIIKLHTEEIQLPNGELSSREIVRHPGGVCILAINENKEILMVEQFRSGPKLPLLEVPAGKLEYGEDPEICALREIEEETGYKPEKVVKLCSFYSSPGFTNEKIYLYLAENLKESKQKLDYDEFLNVKKFKLSELKKMIASDKINDAKTLIAVQFAEKYVSED